MSNSFIIYVSHRSDPSDKMLVRDIAIEASQNNRQKDISGILMGVGDYFLQVLEGQEQVLEELLDKIAKDARHNNLQVLYKGTLPDRLFGQWSMGCVSSKGEAGNHTEHFQRIAEEIDALCQNLTQEKSERLKDLIVRIPSLIASETLKID